MAAKDRKRNALSELRDLADELGMQVSRRKVDLSVADFNALHAQVVALCRTEAQRRRAADAQARYRTDPLPPLPVAHGAGAPAPMAGAQPGAAAAAAPAGAPEGGGAEDAPGEFRLRSTSCLFTWNNGSFANWELNSLWTAFLLFLRGLHFVIEWTATMERSLKSKDQGRVHLHAFVEFKKAPDWTTLSPMRFQDGFPNASPTKARGDNIRVVRDQGHFYAWAWKEGTLFVASSGYEPWRDYPVKGLWIDDLWTQHKLSHDTYLEYAAQVRVGCVNRCKQVEAVRARERSRALQKRRTEVAAELAPLQSEFRADVLARLVPWRSQYQEKLPRYKFLVLMGASRTGKSTLARSLGGTPFTQTVQSALSPDLRGYDPTVHSYILFDNVNDMSFVLDHRALFQANNDVHTLGESKTGMYSYDVWIWKVPIVVTVDLTADWDQHEPWIHDNSMLVFLRGQSWVNRI